MTEFEAIETIRYASAFNSDNSPLIKALDVAIKALEEIQQYRVLGTIEDFKSLKQQDLPKFHLGDEFWVVHYSEVRKEKIVMLQQKKDGTWKYRFPNSADFTEEDHNKYFFDNEDDANKFFEEKRRK